MRADPETRPGAPAPEATPGTRDARGAEPAGPEATWTVLALLRWTTDFFKGRGIETARLDAECLLAAALGCDRMRLYLDFDKPVTPEERGVFREWVRKRGGERVPVAQLVGQKEFWSLPLRITPDVLVPRPETETLVTAALDLVPASLESPRVLEIGTGSGAVALALAHERPHWRIIATDISQEALKLAQENAERLDMADRIGFRAGDGLAAVRGETFDLVVSNPPYVGERERQELPPELAHEPERALFSGPDGLDLIHRLIDALPAQLAPGGALALEHAPHQAEAIASRLSAAGLRQTVTHRDLVGKLRVTTALRGEG